jgi:hypothetical protein
LQSDQNELEWQTFGKSKSSFALFPPQAKVSLFSLQQTLMRQDLVNGNLINSLSTSEELSGATMISFPQDSEADSRLSKF